MNLVYVTTVYNEKIRVNQDDIDDPRKTLIPIYGRNGVKIADQVSYNPKKDLGKTMLHKGNIKS